MTSPISHKWYLRLPSFIVVFSRVIHLEELVSAMFCWHFEYAHISYIFSSLKPHSRLELYGLPSALNAEHGFGLPL